MLRSGIKVTQALRTYVWFHVSKARSLAALICSACQARPRGHCTKYKERVIHTHCFCTSAKDDTHKTKGVPKRTLETNPTETVGSRFCTSLKKVFRLKPSGYEPKVEGVSPSLRRSIAGPPCASGSHGHDGSPTKTATWR